MKGSDVLHLKGTVSVSETKTNNETGKITFYPNPMKDFVKMQFVLPRAGETMITLYDPSGKEVVQTRDMLSGGEHTYSIQGIEEGIYFANAISDGFSLSGKLISTGSKNGSVKITHESSTISQEKSSDSKGTNEEKVMQYNTGDRLKLIGKSGIYSTVVTDIPAASKTITYKFIACTDGDGNNYPVVQIGTAKGLTDNPDPAGEKGIQIWMAKNLKTTKYNEGTAIPYVPDDWTWQTMNSQGFCWYQNNAGNKHTYGGLYNWFTVNKANLCPAGWHVPTRSDWTSLINYMGGEDYAAVKLREVGTSHWVTDRFGTTDMYGFTALPGGLRYGGSSYSAMGYTCYWWSSTMKGDDPLRAWFRQISVSSPNLPEATSVIQQGYSIRCLKD